MSDSLHFFPLLFSDKIMVMNGDNILEYAVEKSENLVLNVTETKYISSAFPIYCFSNLFICSDKSELSETGSFNLEPYSSNLTSFNSSDNMEHETIEKTQGDNGNCVNFIQINDHSASFIGHANKLSVKVIMDSKNHKELNSYGLMEEIRSKEINQNLRKEEERKLSSYVPECVYTKKHNFLNHLSPPSDELLQSSIVTSFRELELDDKDSQSMDCVSSGKQFYNIKNSNCMLNEIHDSFESGDMFESTRNSDIIASNILKGSLSEGVYKTCSENSENEQMCKLKQSDLNKSSTSSNDTFVSVIEEYVYTDEENGVVLIEQRHLVNKIR